MPIRPAAPGIGQRWYFNRPESDFTQKAIEKGWDEQRIELHRQIREGGRKFGYVIIAEDVDEDGFERWVFMRKPVNPHPRSHPHFIRKEWLLKNYRYGEEADIGDIGRSYSVDNRPAA